MDVFVYGTLTEPGQVSRVVDSYAFAGAAVVDGLHPVEGRYPTLAPGGKVAGRILRTEETDALDRYEGVDAGLYVRVELPWAGSPGSSEPPESAESSESSASAGSPTQRGAVAVYVGDPERLGVAESVAWPGDGPLEARVRRYVVDAGVTIRPAD